MGTVDMWSLFKEQLLHVLDKYVPVRQGGGVERGNRGLLKKLNLLLRAKRRPI